MQEGTYQRRVHTSLIIEHHRVPPLLETVTLKHEAVRGYFSTYTIDELLLYLRIAASCLHRSCVQIWSELD